MLNASGRFKNRHSRMLLAGIHAAREIGCPIKAFGHYNSSIVELSDSRLLNRPDEWVYAQLAGFIAGFELEILD